jgi:hypothetical protein
MEVRLLGYPLFAGIPRRVLMATLQAQLDICMAQALSDGLSEEEILDQCPVAHSLLDDIDSLMPTPSYRSMKDILGHWEIEKIPSAAQMAIDCPLYCLETQLLNQRRSAGASSATYFIANCGGDVCDGPFTPNGLCSSNQIETLKCAERQKSHDLCNMDTTTPDRLSVKHFDYDSETLLHTYYIPLDGDFDADPPLAQFTATDNDGKEETLSSLAHIVNFDVRPLDMYQKTKSDSDGQFVSKIAAVVKGREENEVQLISVSRCFVYS